MGVCSLAAVLVSITWGSGWSSLSEMLISDSSLRKEKQSIKLLLLTAPPPLLCCCEGTAVPRRGRRMDPTRARSLCPAPPKGGHCPALRCNVLLQRPPCGADPRDLASVCVI